jgi:hypothetical protein
MMRRFTANAAMRMPLLVPAAVLAMTATALAAPSPTYTLVDLDVGAQPNSIVAADFNRDGALDLAVALGPDDVVSVFAGDASGGFTHLRDLATGPYPVSVRAADVNHDGFVDLITGNHHAGTITVLLGRGDGTFQPARTFTASTTWATSPDWGYIGTPLSVDIADYNGDGNVDLAVPLVGYGSFSVLLGGGDGTFNTLIEAAGNGCDDPQATAAADFNGDGILDLAVASDWWCQAIITGLGDGRFSDPKEFFASPNSKSVRIVDLNGDTYLDLVFANSWSSGVSVLLGDGADGVLPPASYGTGLTPAFVTLADLNGDGLLDILSANTGSDTVSLLFGDGSGRFTGEIALATDAAPRSVATGDFTSDGAIDFAVANEGGSTVSLFLTTSPCDSDRTPPVIDSVTAAPSVLWPPRHRLEPVTLDVVASDACSDVTCRVMWVRSNDPDADGLDWLTTGDQSVQLRSERSGQAGRDYVITVECLDAAGNASYRDVVVTVPHDRRP